MEYTDNTQLEGNAINVDHSEVMQGQPGTPSTTSAKNIKNSPTHGSWTFHWQCLSPYPNPLRLSGGTQSTINTALTNFQRITVQCESRILTTMGRHCKSFARRKIEYSRMKNTETSCIFTLNVTLQKHCSTANAIIHLSATLRRINAFILQHPHSGAV